MVGCKSRCPDVLVPDKTNEYISKIVLIEIKSPKPKKNSNTSDLVHKQSFYVKNEDRVPVLIKDRSNGYYAQVQMAM